MFFCLFVCLFDWAQNMVGHTLRLKMGAGYCCVLIRVALRPLFRYCSGSITTAKIINTEIVSMRSSNEISLIETLLSSLLIHNFHNLPLRSIGNFMIFSLPIQKLRIINV